MVAVYGEIPTPTTTLKRKVFPIAHDIFSPRHGRSFQELFPDKRGARDGAIES